MNNFRSHELDAALSVALSRAQTINPLAREFLDPGLARPRYALGRNTQTDELIRLGLVDAVIDDFVEQPSMYNGFAVVRSTSVERDAFVVSCSTSIAPVNVRRSLSRSGFLNVLEFGEIVQAAGGQVTPPWFVTQQFQSWELRGLDWRWLYDSLADTESQRVLREVLAFRLTARSEHMSRYEIRLDEQYFEPFMEFREEIFVDAGGFDGDTSEAFCRRYPDYKFIYFIEPSQTNLARARVRLEKCRDIAFLNVAVSNECGEMAFDAESGSASSFNTHGSTRVAVSSIDKLIDAKTTTIKMDLEGHETLALEGAVGHVRKYRPKVACAVYHAANDFIDVALFLRNLHPDYRIYLRHYTQGWSETVMYFV